MTDETCPDCKWVKAPACLCDYRAVDAARVRNAISAELRESGLPEENVERWWDRPSPFLNHQTPADVLSHGDTLSVMGAAQALMDGVYLNG